MPDMIDMQLRNLIDQYNQIDWKQLTRSETFNAGSNFSAQEPVFKKTREAIDVIVKGIKVLEQKLPPQQLQVITNQIQLFLNLKTRITQYSDISKHNQVVDDIKKTCFDIQEGLERFMKYLDIDPDERVAALKQEFARLDEIQRTTRTAIEQELQKMREETKRVLSAEDEIVAAKKELEAELQRVKEETQRLLSTGKDVGLAKGGLASVRLAAHFTEEANRYQSMADDWYRFLRYAYGGIVIVITLFALGYWLEWFALTLQSGASKLVFLAALWYGLSFMIRNYNVNSHLAAVNRHRTAVASTLQDFLATDSNATGEVLGNATEAMFKHMPIGFISRAEKDNSSPVYDIINNVIGSRSTQ